MDIGDRCINNRAAAVFDFAHPSGIEERSGDAASAEVVEEGLGLFEVGGVEAFLEPAEDWGEQCDRLLRPALLSAQTGYRFAGGMHNL